MRSDSGGFVPEGKHGDSAWQKSTADEVGGGRGGVGGSYLCGFLPLGAEDGEMPDAGMSGSSA